MDENIKKLAISLGFMELERNGVMVWYDPEGGHVSWAELPNWLNRRLDQLIEEAGEPLAEDMAALAKLGNPFRSGN